MSSVSWSSVQTMILTGVATALDIDVVSLS
jgi:hypothetical protein